MWSPSCGHEGRIPCKMEHTVTPEELQDHCNHPCRFKFNQCGHTCIGNCGKCFQGHVHAKCEEQCHRLLMCGHRCEASCWQICPPCPVESCKNGEQKVFTARNEIIANEREVIRHQIALMTEILTPASYYSFERLRDHLEDLTWVDKKEKNRADCVKFQHAKMLNQYEFESIHKIFCWWKVAEAYIALLQKKERENKYNAEHNIGDTQKGLSSEDLILGYNSIIRQLVRRKIPLSERESYEFNMEFERIESLVKIALICGEVSKFDTIAVKKCNKFKDLLLSRHSFTNETKLMYEKKLEACCTLIDQDVVLYITETVPLTIPTFQAKSFAAPENTHGEEMHQHKSVVENVPAYLQKEEGEEEFGYVQKYKDQEKKLILKVNANWSNGQIPLKQRLSKQQRVVDNNESVLGSLPSMHRGSGDHAEEDEKAFYKDFNMNKRNFDSTCLAIHSMKDEIMEVVNSHQVVIVEGFTGCGKTTQVPQFILEDAAAEGKYCKIVVTQPRRIAAISVATRVSEERGWPLGQLVGYQVGMKRETSDKSRLVYVTTGVLLQTLINMKNLDEYSHIIIDEVHERDLDTDLLMLVLKTLLIQNEDNKTKILLMSATLNAEKFREYFPIWKSFISGKEGAAIVKVPSQQTYPVDIKYLGDILETETSKMYKDDFYDEPKIASEIYGTVVFLIQHFEKMENKQKGGARGAVLVFLPGLLEIEAMHKALVQAAKVKDKGKQSDMQWLILPFYSSMTRDEQQRVFLPPEIGYRKIILATNIAESSITVSDIKFVIDFCLTKSLSCDPNTNYTCLSLEWASKFQCTQRKGRCGRVSEGTVYRLVPQEFYNKFVEEPIPEMKKSSLESTVLHVKKLDIGSPKKRLALALDPPKLSGIERAVANLKEVGALTITKTKDKSPNYTPYDGDLTNLGKIMNSLPIDIRLGKLIAMGHIFGVIEECIVIAAGMSTKTPFSSPFFKRLEAYSSKLLWMDNSYSDSFALVFVFKEWKINFEKLEKPDEKGWERKYLVQGNVMREISNLVEEIQRRLKNIGICANLGDKFFKSNISIDKSMDKALLLKIAIAGAFYPNYFVRSRPQDSVATHDIPQELSCRNPFNFVVLRGTPNDLPFDLYKWHVIEKFRPKDDRYGVTVPYAEHEGAKVFINFDSMGDKIGEVSLGVYMAIKMRQLGELITVAHYEPEQVQDLVGKLSNMTLHKKGQVKAPPQTLLPPVCVEDIRVRVSHVVSPTEFYCIKTEDLDSRNHLRNVLGSLTSGNLCNPSRKTLEEGDLVIIRTKAGYVRARLDLILYNSVILCLIDDGGFVVRGLKNVFIPSTWDSSITTIPGLAIQCRLRNTRPPVQTGGIWFNEIKNKFKAIVFDTIPPDSECTLQVFSVVDAIVAGDLLSQEKQSIIQKLRDENVIEFVPEWQQSISNNGMRYGSTVKGETIEEQKARTAKQARKEEFIPSKVIRPPEVSEIREPEIITLKGPSSPLEMSFNALCKNSKLKQAIIDNSSGNSVALDMEYLDPCARLLVAGSIGISHRSGNLIIRETTLLPALPCLTGLLTMMFCPVIMLRASKQQYTGALAGLGMEPAHAKAIYPDHDVEVFFDAKIDNDDIDSINKIRKTMNLILEPNQNTTLEALRKTIQKDTKELLFRKREKVTESCPDANDSHKWKELPKHLLLSPAAEANESKSQLSDVFKLHDALDLNAQTESDDEENDAYDY